MAKLLIRALATRTATPIKASDQRPSSAPVPTRSTAGPTARSVRPRKARCSCAASARSVSRTRTSRRVVGFCLGRKCGRGPWCCECRARPQQRDPERGEDKSGAHQERVKPTQKRVGAREPCDSQKWQDQAEHMPPGRALSSSENRHERGSGYRKGKKKVVRSHDRPPVKTKTKTESRGPDLDLSCPTTMPTRSAGCKTCAAAASSNRL